MMQEHDLEIVCGCLAAHPNQRGGQHVARQCTAVLVIHKPSGLAVRSDRHRSQHGNRLEAIERLRLYLVAVGIAGVDWETTDNAAADGCACGGAQHIDGGCLCGQKPPVQKP